MKCSQVRTFLSQISDRADQITPIPPADLDYLSVNGYVLRTTQDDYTKGVDEVARLSQMTADLGAGKARNQQEDEALQQVERKQHSILFRFEQKEEKDEMDKRVQAETSAVAGEISELSSLEANVNALIQEKSTIDRMVPYDGGYLSLTDMGTIILSDLNVRDYRVADQEFADFLTEIKAVYAELRTIADRAASYLVMLRSSVPEIEDVEYSTDGSEPQAPSLFWSIAIGLGKLQGDTGQIAQRFIQALNSLRDFKSTVPSKLMAAEIMTALSSQDLRSLESALTDLDRQFRDQGIPQEISAGVAATIMAGMRYDGTYPTDRFAQFNKLTSSYESAAILAVMNVPYADLTAKFQSFRALFASWGYTPSDDVEMASAFLAIGELGADEAGEKLKYVIEQLKNYLAYPLVAAAILASMPVFEAHEVLDLMEKAVTLLSGYAAGLERSELVALAVRMIHGVRNELVKEIDPTATITNTPVQFTYGSHPGFIFWYSPVIIAHSSYYWTFSGMGGFHPAHSHGIGGFAG